MLNLKQSLKRKGDRRYWRWWRLGSNSGVSEIGLLRADIV